eukprot:Gb_35978 [translate_table: standard]
MVFGDCVKNAEGLTSIEFI